MSDRETPDHVPITAETMFTVELDRLCQLSEEGYPAAAHEALRLCLRKPKCQFGTALFNDEGVLVPKRVLHALSEIVLDLLEHHHTTGKGRNAKWPSRYNQDMIDFARYEAVEHIMANKENGPTLEEMERYDTVVRGKTKEEIRPILKQKVTWGNVWEWASWYLEGEDAAGAPDTIRSSCRRVKANLKKDPGRYRVYRFLRPVRSRVRNC